MAIVISGVNNNDRITASDGLIDLLGANLGGTITAPAFTATGNLTAGHINVGDSIQFGNAGIITATTLIGNVTGNVNHNSDLLLQISGSEKLRIANSGAFGLNGTNYGTSGQVLTSQGSGSSPTWSTISVGGDTGIDFNNNVKIRFGTGNDLEIYHDSSDNISKIDNLTHNILQIRNLGNNKIVIKPQNSFPVELYFNNNKKIETTNTGAVVTGICTATSFCGDGSALTGTGVGSNTSINTTGIITATAFVPTTGQLSHRNIVINGAMLIAQRATSSGGEGYKTVDRFQFYKSGTNETPNQAQVDVASGTTPYSLGFRKAYQIQNGNQSSAGSSDLVFLETNLEAKAIANSGWNYTSSSGFVTLSFWVKASVAMNYYGYLITVDGTAQRYTFETGALSADTWTKVTKTIPGNSNLQFDNNSAKGLGIVWWPYLGDTYTDSGVTLNQWAPWATGTRTPDYDRSSSGTWYMTNDSTFQITGVQLEVGNVATPFEHRLYPEELRRCQRYYQKDHSRNRRFWGSGNVSGRQFPVRFDVEMRDTPSVSFPSTSIDSGSLSANGINKQGYYTNMSGSGRFYEWQHIAESEI